MQNRTLVEEPDIDAITFLSSPSFLGVVFNSRPNALRQLILSREIIRIYHRKKGSLGLDIGSKYADLKIILSDFNVKVIRLDIISREGKKDFIQADGHKMPFKNQSFDFVIISHVLAHVRDLDNFLSEVNRLLRPGGKIFILQSNRYGWWKFWSYYIRRNDRHCHYRTFDIWGICGKLSQFSFDISKMYCPYYFYTHSKLSYLFFSLDRKLEGRIPLVFATQWLIVANKRCKVGNSKFNIKSPNFLIRSILVITASAHSVILKSLEILLRIMIYFRRQFG